MCSVYFAFSVRAQVVLTTTLVCYVPARFVYYHMCRLFPPYPPPPSLSLYFLLQILLHALRVVKRVLSVFIVSLLRTLSLVIIYLVAKHAIKRSHHNNQYSSRPLSWEISFDYNTNGAHARVYTSHHLPISHNRMHLAVMRGSVSQSEYVFSLQQPQLSLRPDRLHRCLVSVLELILTLRWEPGHSWGILSDKRDSMPFV